MKKILAIVLSLCLFVSLFGCGRNSTANTQDNSGKENTAATDTGTSTEPSSNQEKTADPSKNTMTAAFSSDRGTLDPLYYSGFDIQNIMCMVYEPLWAWDNEGNQEFKLATACEMIEPTRWHITLREGVKFTNGSDFKANDVLFTLDMANNRVGEAQFLPELDLENCKALDDYNVELVFHNYDCTYSGTMGMLLMYDEESYDANTITSVAIGTGPYKVKDYVVNSHLTLEVNEDYWGEQPGIPNLEFKLIAEDSQKTNELAAGSIDLSAVPFQDIDYVKSLGDYNVVLNDVAETSAMYFNTSEKSIFYNNVDARWAVCLAIDREAIVNIAYNGYANVSQMPCATSNIDVTEDMKNLGVYGEGYNPEKAKELAEKSGLAGQTISFCTDGTPAAIATAECVQSDLNEIGVNVEIKNYDAGTWMSVLFDPNQSGDIMLYMVAMPSHTVGACMSAWYSYGLGGLLASNPFPEKETFDELCNGILAISDEAELHRRSVELCRIHSDAALWFGLVDKQSATAVRNGLEGYRIMQMINIVYQDLYWTAG